MRPISRALYTLVEFNISNLVPVTSSPRLNGDCNGDEFTLSKGVVGKEAIAETLDIG